MRGRGGFGRIRADPRRSCSDEQLLTYIQRVLGQSPPTLGLSANTIRGEKGNVTEGRRAAGAAAGVTQSTAPRARARPATQRSSMFCGGKEPLLARARLPARERGRRPPRACAPLAPSHVRPGLRDYGLMSYFLRPFFFTWNRGLFRDDLWNSRALNLLFSD